MVSISVRSRLRCIYHALLTDGFPIGAEERLAPFFIVGSGRSGTTLMRRILLHSPEVYIPPENWSLGGIISDFRQYRWVMPWKNIVLMTMGRLVTGSHRWFESPPADLRKKLTSLPEAQRNLARLIDETYQYHGRKQNAVFESWGDKTPLNINNLEAILGVFPEARFLHLIRDGADVVHSWTKLGRYDGDPLGAAKRWRSAIEKATKFKKENPEKLLEIRYERLVKQPKEVTRQVCAHIGISYKEGMEGRFDHLNEMESAKSQSHYENVFGSITEENIGRGRSALKLRERESLRPLMNDKLIELGYEPL